MFYNPIYAIATTSQEQNYVLVNVPQQNGNPCLILYNPNQLLMNSGSQQTINNIQHNPNQLLMNVSTSASQQTVSNIQQIQPASEEKVDVKTFYDNPEEFMDLHNLNVVVPENAVNNVAKPEETKHSPQNDFKEFIDLHNVNVVIPENLNSCIKTEDVGSAISLNNNSLENSWDEVCVKEEPQESKNEILIEHWADMEVELDPSHQETKIVDASQIIPTKKPKRGKHAEEAVKVDLNEADLEKVLVNENGNFSCPYCEYKTGWKNNLRKHIVSRHMKKEEIAWFHCAHCSYKGKTKEYLIVHLRSNHDLSINWHTCPHCDFTTKYSATLKYHVLDNHTENANVLECPHCEFKANHKVKISRHMKYKHTVQWFKCEQCQFKTRHRKHLDNHIICKHVSEENINWFMCEMCGMRFKLKRGLTDHQKIHYAKMALEEEETNQTNGSSENDTK